MLRGSSALLADSHDVASVDVTAFRSSAAVTKDFATSAPIVGFCHTLGMDMGDGTTLSFKVHRKVRRIHGQRTFVMSMHGGYMGIPMNMAMTVSQLKNYEVMTMLMGANRSTSYVTRMTGTLRRAQIAKLTPHLH